jgi:hypothetical protein
MLVGSSYGTVTRWDSEIWRRAKEGEQVDALRTTALGLAGIWLGILTVVVVLVVRQIALLTARLASTDGETFLANDGPLLDTTVPQEALSLFPALERGRLQLLLLSGNCRPCRELAVELDRQHFQSPNTVVLASGRPELTDALVTLLPEGTRVLRDPEASGIARALHIQSTPFAVAVEDRVVVAKTYVHEPANLLQLVNGGTVAVPAGAIT